MQSEGKPPLHEAAARNPADCQLLGELTLVIGTETEGAARDVFGAFCTVAAVVVSRRSTWAPYTKLGSHSLISAPFRLFASSKREVHAAIDAACDRVIANVESEGSGADWGVISIPYRSGDFTYERILDGRIVSFKVPRVVWAHFFIQSDTGFQSDLRERFE